MTEGLRNMSGRSMSATKLPRPATKADSSLVGAVEMNLYFFDHFLPQHSVGWKVGLACSYNCGSQDDRCQHHRFDNLHIASATANVA